MATYEELLKVRDGLRQQAELGRIQAANLAEVAAKAEEALAKADGVVTGTEAKVIEFYRRQAEALATSQPPSAQAVDPVSPPPPAPSAQPGVLARFFKGLNPFS